MLSQAPPSLEAYTFQTTVSTWLSLQAPAFVCLRNLESTCPLYLVLELVMGGEREPKALSPMGKSGCGCPGRYDHRGSAFGR